MNCPLLKEPFPRSVFVTGTGTDVGKTVACAVLSALWEAEYWKPVQAGLAQQDMLEVLRLSPTTAVHLSALALEEPASPHLAARREEIELDVAALVDACPTSWCLVVEGAGGARVPLSETHDMTDLALGLGYPVVVVASTGLGTLHHTLSTLDTLRSRGVDVAGVLLSGNPHGENARVIRDRGGVTILGRVPPLFPLDEHAVGEVARRWLDGQWVDPCEEPTPDARPVKPERSLAQRDAAVAWHPFTQHATMPEPLEIASGHGAILRTVQGDEIIDAISSWWVTNHGHGHPHIANAVAQQARQLEQVIFAGCTHEPAVALAERLLPVLPGKPSRLFFSDDGSTSVEVALKACIQRAVRRGVSHPRVAALANAYHGDTFGAMAVGERSLFSRAFEPMLFSVDRLPTPAGNWMPEGSAAEAALQASIEAVHTWLETWGSQAACLIVEPLVQGSEGMLFYGRRWLEEVDALCHAAGVPWIADEVFTGFGRTGRLFACGDVPDAPTLRPSAVCLSKGLTGGFLPMGVTAFQEEIFEDFLSDDRGRAFFHGHSFTANPLGCAAALASLDLSLDATLPSRWAQIEQWHRQALQELQTQFPIQGARVLGTIAAFELPNAPGGYLASRGQQVAVLAREHGVLLRPLGDTVYVLPPYCLRKKQHDQIFEALHETLEILLEV